MVRYFHHYFHMHIMSCIAAIHIILLLMNSNNYVGTWVRVGGGLLFGLTGRSGPCGRTWITSAAHPMEPRGGVRIL